MSAITSFQQLLLHAGIAALNPMQQEAIRTITAAENTWIKAPTGSGKTLAYLFPLLPLLQHQREGCQVFILSPARELALQIGDVFRRLQTGFGVSVFYGGHRMRSELDQLRQPPAILVATPGRLADHLRHGRIDTSNLHYLVMDEFDKCQELGFSEDINFILSRLPALKKRICVSATGSPDDTVIAGFTHPQKVEYTRLEEASGLTLYHVSVSVDSRTTTLFQLLSVIGHETTLVFCARRDDVDMLHQDMLDRGLPCTRFHGGVEQVDRERALIRIRQGSARILITTDLAARGIDIPEVRHVVHFDLSRKEEEFLHRNGRTARMQAVGAAYLLSSDRHLLPDYAAASAKPFILPKVSLLPIPDWETLYVNLGRKQKIRKLDVVGWLLQKGGLRPEELGRVDIMDDRSYAAVPREKAKGVIQLLQSEPLKKKKARIFIAKE